MRSLMYNNTIWDIHEAVVYHGDLWDENGIKKYFSTEIVNSEN